MDQTLLRLLESFPGVVWVTDKELRYELVTGADLVVLGMSPVEIVGRTVTDILGSDEVAFPAIAAHRRALAGEAAEYEQTYRGFVRRGRVEPIRDAAGAVVGAAGISTDITGERETGRTLAEFGAIVASTGDAIIGKSLDGTVTSWNAAAERVYGYAAAEIIGRSIALLLPDDRADELRTIFDRVGRGEIVQPYETIRVRKDGTPISVSLTVSPIKDAAVPS